MSLFSKITAGLCVLMICDGLVLLTIREARSLVQSVIPRINITAVAAAEISLGILSLYLMMR